VNIVYIGDIGGTDPPGPAAGTLDDGPSERPLYTNAISIPTPNSKEVKMLSIIEEHLIAVMKERKVKELLVQISEQTENNELDRLLYLEKFDKEEFDKEMEKSLKS
jgi:hypothetical protein